MPYIQLGSRPDIDAVLVGLIDPPLTYGEMNYVITKLLLATEPGTYNDYDSLIGLLECCKLEFYRRKVAPYEDVKRTQNGDVY